MAWVGEEFPLACPACGGDIRLSGDGQQAAGLGETLRQRHKNATPAGKAGVPETAFFGPGRWSTRLTDRFIPNPPYLAAPAFARSAISWAERARRYSRTSSITPLAGYA